jgi:hypothetical protein
MQSPARREALAFRPAPRRNRAAVNIEDGMQAELVRLILSLRHGVHRGESHWWPMPTGAMDSQGAPKSSQRIFPQGSYFLSGILSSAAL